MPTTPVPPGEPEYLGDATPASAVKARQRRTGRGAVLGLAVAGVAGVVALGGWTALSLMASGTQPATALPADTVAYVSLDLDPSAGQKLEAVRMLEKFPALDEELGLDASDDLRRWAFDRSGLARCAGVDYDEDVAPWIGDRAALAVVPASGTEQSEGPEMVVALQVSDTDAATTALGELADCKVADGAAGREPGFAAGEGHVVVARSAAVAEATVERAADASLAEDETFQRWTGEAGAAGIATGYLSPEAPGELAALARELESRHARSGFGTPGGMDEHPLLSGGEVGHSFDLGGLPLSGPLGSGPGGPGLAGGMTEDFEGMAGVLRFADETLELEVAGAGMPEGAAPGSGGTTVTELPATTGAAASWAFEEGWFSTALDSFTELSGGLPLDPMFRLVEARTGLSLPEDAETLLGDSLAVAVDSSLEAAPAIEDEDPSQLPAGVRVSGDADEILAVVEKVRDRLGSRTDELVVESGDQVVAFGFDQEYVEALVADGGLGDEPVFRDAVPQADRAGGVLFVDFGAGDEWVERLVEDYGKALEGRSPADVDENLRPLQALGISTWTDDGVQRGLLRLTTR